MALVTDAGREVGDAPGRGLLRWLLSVRVFPNWRGRLEDRLRRLLALIAACSVPAAFFYALAQPPPATEYQVKATFLYNFAQYVEWPATSFTASGDSFKICVLGEDPFGHVLDDTIEGEAINGRRLVARRLSRVNEALKCQILFVSSSEEGRLEQILTALDGKSIMTVGEMPRFAERGGMINFRLEGTKVRFDINPEAAQRAALTLSSQLLKLARIVRGNPQRGG